VNAARIATRLLGTSMCPELVGPNFRPKREEAWRPRDCPWAVLRLHCELKLSYQQIARFCALARVPCTRAQVFETGRVPEGWDEAKLETALFPSTAVKHAAPGRMSPDFAGIHEQLRSHKHLTLQLL